MDGVQIAALVGVRAALPGQGAGQDIARGDAQGPGFAALLAVQDRPAPMRAGVTGRAASGQSGSASGASVPPAAPGGVGGEKAGDAAGAPPIPTPSFTLPTPAAATSPTVESAPGAAGPEDSAAEGTRPVPPEAMMPVAAPLMIAATSQGLVAADGVQAVPQAAPAFEAEAPTSAANRAAVPAETIQGAPPAPASPPALGGNPPSVPTAPVSVPAPLAASAAPAPSPKADATDSPDGAQPGGSGGTSRAASMSVRADALPAVPAATAQAAALRSAAVRPEIQRAIEAAAAALQGPPASTAATTPAAAPASAPTTSAPVAPTPIAPVLQEQAAAARSASRGQERVEGPSAKSGNGANTAGTAQPFAGAQAAAPASPPMPAAPAGATLSEAALAQGGSGLAPIEAMAGDGVLEPLPGALTAQAPASSPLQGAAAGLAGPAGARLPAQTIPALVRDITARATRDGSTLEIRLDPGDLGKVGVRLETLADGQVHASIQAERAETLSMLARQHREIERALAEAGVTLARDGLEFSLSDQGGGRDAERGGQGLAGGRGLEAFRDTAARAAEPMLAIDTRWARARVNLIA